MNTWKEAKTLYDLKYGASPTYHPEKNVFYYTYTSFDKIKKGYRSDIWSYNLETNTERPLIQNTGENHSPTYQNGYLLYLSNQNETKKKQIHCYEFATGTEEVLTQTEFGISYVAWIPHSDSFVFTTALWDNGKPSESEKNPHAHRITTLNYQADGVGFVDCKKQNYLCEQSIHNQEHTVIAPQATGYSLRRVASVSKDGQFIYFEGRVESDSEWNQDSAVFAYNRETSEIRKITESFSEGIYSEATVSPNGKYIAMVGSELPYETNNQFDLYLYNEESKEFTNLSEEVDIQFADTSVSDFFRHISRPLIQWAPDGESFYVQTSEYGSVLLYRVSLNGEMTVISGKDRVLKEYLILENGDILASFSRYNQPFSWQIFDGKDWENCPTEIEKHYNNYQYADYEEIQYKARDGGIIHGYLVYPPNFDSSKKYPLILNIHGGPYPMHAANFYHESQHMAANNYFVLLINPRGSYGYGQEHVMGVYEHYGKEDYTDLMTAVSEVCKEFPYVDDENLFVTGGSYGGFMTNWIVTQDHRFKAAASQRSMANFVSLFSTSDIGYFFFRDQLGADIQNVEKLWENSPQAYVAQVETPLLLLHPLNDLRCPFEQAQQFYTSLKYFGKETEMLVFHNASHELSRSGNPEQRIQRLEGIMEWFERYYE